MDKRKLEGTIIKEYLGDYERPKIATYSDGKYYSLDFAYGAGIYDFHVGSRPDSREFLFTTKYGEIIDVAAEGDWLVWGEDYQSKKRVEYKAYHVESRAMQVLKVTETENVKPYPIIALAHGKAFFIECLYPEKEIVIWQYDLENNQEKEIYRFDSYELYKPLVETSGDYLYAPVGMTDGKVELMEYSILTGEIRMVPLPEKVHILYALDYDRDRDIFALYYQEENRKSETIALYRAATGNLKEIGEVNKKQRMERDKLLFWNGNAVWIEYNDTWYAMREINCRRILHIYNVDKEKTYILNQERVAEYFFDETALYAISIDEEGKHYINRVN